MWTRCHCGTCTVCLQMHRSEECYNVLRTEAAMVPARWCGQWTSIFRNFFVLMTLMITCRMMIGSTKFRDLLQPVLTSFASFSYFQNCFLDTRGKSKKAQVEGVFWFFPLQFSSTKTIRFANTDGDQSKTWIMWLWELVLSFSGCATDLWNHFGLSVLENAGPNCAWQLSWWCHTIPYHLGMCPFLDGSWEFSCAWCA